MILSKIDFPSFKVILFLLPFLSFLLSFFLTYLSLPYLSYAHLPFLISPKIWNSYCCFRWSFCLSFWSYCLGTSHNNLWYIHGHEYTCNTTRKVALEPDVSASRRPRPDVRAPSMSQSCNRPQSELALLPGACLHETAATFCGVTKVCRQNRWQKDFMKGRLVIECKVHPARYKDIHVRHPLSNSRWA